MCSMVIVDFAVTQRDIYGEKYEGVLWTIIPGERLGAISFYSEQLVCR